MISGIVAALTPHLVELVFALISLYIVPKIGTWLKLKADDSRRSYLESALYNALRAGAVKLAGGTPTVAQLEAIKTDIVNFAFDYTKDGVPDALAKLGVGDERLIALLESRWPYIVQDVAQAVKELKSKDVLKG